ncbi:tetratricopeptide repeat protein [Brevibacillus ginsengisoli]|uniref:tetratricopeptide repeat protein n=1 Tax=Brevibacillus ginsengisoli TaxID=363854 RepID=UPI003CE6A42D
MKFEEYFSSLLNQIDRIERDWETADGNRRMMLAGELREHRQISDQIVDQWIQYEEKLSHLIKKVKQSTIKAFEEEQIMQSHSQLFTQAPTTPSKWTKQEEAEETYQHLFRKGEGFYHLRLFEDAKSHFADLIQHYPDWEHGRLYYAYSLLFSGDTEAGIKEFRLLSRSASSPKVATISYNAIGSILAQTQQYLEASQAFQEALEIAPDHPESLYNLALCYLHTGDAQEAIEAIEEYLENQEDDWEAHVVWMRAAKLLHSQDQTVRYVPPVRIQVPTRDSDPQLLREMAMNYEANGQIHLAYKCYQILVEVCPGQGWTWHGLAWNSWLIEGKERAIPLIKKAISLAPKNVDYLFSYGWMQLCGGQIDQAVKIFRFILSTNRNHYLSLSGMISVYAKLGDYLEAKRIAQSFLDAEDRYVRSLGCYHLGRIAVSQENWKLAKHYFKQVIYDTDQFKEVPHYIQLCNHKLGVQHSLQDENLYPVNSM